VLPALGQELLQLGQFVEDGALAHLSDQGLGAAQGLQVMALLEVDNNHVESTEEQLPLVLF